MLDLCTDLVLVISDSIGLDFDQEEFGPHDLLFGILVETEHGPVDSETDVTGGSLEAAAKIAWAHLREHHDYYEELSEMEEELKKKTAESTSLEKRLASLVEEFIDELDQLLDRFNRGYEELDDEIEGTVSDLVWDLAEDYENAVNKLEPILDKLDKDFRKRK
jgi:chromosome segregation ATPase